VATRPPVLPTPRQTSVVRVLAAAACLAVLLASIAVLVLAVRIDSEVQRLSREADTVIVELREGAQELRDASATAP
jgi:hypothetical protein